MEAFLAAVNGRKWIVMAALLIGAVVRLLKSDTPLPFQVPPRWRAWLAVWLGVLSGVLNAATSGTPWAVAIAHGLTAAAAAITGHELVVEGIRKGREIGAPANDNAPTTKRAA